MKTIRITLPLLLLAAGGFAQDIRYNFSPSGNFAAYKTYKWVPIKGAEQLNQMAEEQLKAAVDAQLVQKGLTKTDGETADLFIGYQTAVGQEKQMTTFDSGWGYGPGWRGGWYGGGGGMTTSTTSTIYIGQVSLDMYDVAQKQLVWRGVASKTIDTKAKPEKRQKNLNKAMTKLFKNYPPPPKKS